MSTWTSVIVGDLRGVVDGDVIDGDGAKVNTIMSSHTDEPRDRHDQRDLEEE
jgi:hypothetical protein